MKLTKKNIKYWVCDCIDECDCDRNVIELSKLREVVKEYKIKNKYAFGTHEILDNLFGEVL